MASKYKRVLLKLSGEAIAGNKGFGIDPAITGQVADDIAEVYQDGVEIAIVIGAGNFIRGATAEGVSRVAGDTMGMLGTVINSIAIKEYLEAREIPARVLTAVHCDRAGEYFTPDLAIEYMKMGIVVVIAGGTGNPFFTTDTAAALRSAEIGADVVLKATKVDGVYDSDPAKNPNAVRFEMLTHAEALARELKVMDATAFSFCQEYGVDIIVFKLLEKGNLRKCIQGQPVGTTVTSGGKQ
ncbi:MAG: UMP kinase [Fibrobacter sp.]|nr:UMP kinase [Fibrobacter sp.]